MKLKSTAILLVLIGITALCACKKAVIEPTPEYQPVQYIYVGHPRQETNPGMIAEFESIDYSKYEMRLLGGDLAYLTTEFNWVIEYIDGILDLSNPNTLWAPGNHDYSNPGMIPLYTNRPLHYTHNHNNITYLVLDSEADSCRISGPQLDLFNSVTDTISESSHLIVMTHKLIWMRGNAILEPMSDTISNGSIGPGNWQINENNFYDDIYWKLLELQNKGVQVICVAGDMGLFETEFEHRFDSGIQFLASGSHFNSTTNKVLIFDHIVETGELSWKFVPLEDL